MKNVDAKKVAEKVGVTPAYIRMMLAGARRPSLPLALKIYDATGLRFGGLARLSESEINAARKVVA